MTIRPKTALTSVLLSLWLTGGVLCSAAWSGGVSPGHTPRVAGDPMLLADVRFWGYQIQNVDALDALDLLARSNYDMLVLEPTRTDWSSDTKNFDTKAMVDSLKNTPASDGVHRKLVIAYIDIGEAEDWRWYWDWSTEWTPGTPFPGDWPDYIVAPDPDGWGGNYPVAYWDPDWKDIVIYGQNQGSDPSRNYDSMMDEVIKDGFDGVYLDWVEGFENETVAQVAAAAGKDPAVEMINFIREIRDSGRAWSPGFLVIQQNAAGLIEGHSELLNTIDAIAQEAIWYDGDATDDWNDPNGHDFVNDSDLVDYYLGYLSQYQAGGMPVFACEYALDSADNAYERAADSGFIPYCTRRSLGALTTTPPPGYDVGTSVRMVGEGTLLPTYSLDQNYPNPFNASTQITLDVPVYGRVSVSVYNILGREVARLIPGDDMTPGTWSVSWDGRDLRGRPVASGVYFYRMTAPGFSETRKMTLLK